MTDPLSIGALSAVALSEGIKFVYDQAKELLKRWREKRDHGETGVLEVTVPPSNALDAPLSPTRIQLTVVEEHAEDLTALRRALIEYAEEGKAPDPGDPHLLETVDALRRLLELAYGQRITFRDEQRERTGTRIDSRVEAGVVNGYLAGVRARGGLADVDIVSRVKVDQVETNAEVLGVDYGRSGEPTDMDG